MMFLIMSASHICKMRLPCATKLRYLTQIYFGLKQNTIMLIIDLYLEKSSITSWLWSFLMKYVFLFLNDWAKKVDPTWKSEMRSLQLGPHLRRYAFRYAVQSYSSLWNCINLMHRIDFDSVQEWQGAGIFGKLYNWLRRWLSVFVLTISADLLP